MTTQKICCLILACLLPFSYLYGQKVEINGRVSDANTGTPLIGATIALIGSTQGTRTNQNGEFSLQLEAGQDSLQVSYFGYLTKRISHKNQQNIQIILSPKTTSLEEIVVVGYGSMRKSDLTGSVYSVKGDDLLKNPSANALQALQGKVPGVQVSSSSGNPGESPIIRIRGVATFLGGASPVFVVDGVILGDISFLNSGDIQSIEVLKDASATAIYGTRGANGVIVITTKRGQEGDPLISFSANRSLEYVSKKIDLLEGPEFAQIVNELFPGTYNNIDLLPNTDWQGEIFTAARPIQQYEVSASASQDRHAYYLGGSFYQQEGVIGKSDYERISIKLNNSLTATDYLKLGSDLSFSIERKNIAPNLVSSAYRAWPVSQPRDEAGNFAEVMGSGNPLAALEYRDVFNRRYRAIGNLYAEVSFLQNFTFKTSYQADLELLKGTSFIPAFFVSPTQQNERNNLSKSSRDRANWIWENTLTFTKELPNHRFNVLAGYTTQHNLSEGLTGTVESLLRETSDFYYLDAGDATSINAFNGRAEFSYISYLFRINYSWLNKYLFTGTFRRDGSSKFGPKNRYGNFPSLALGWRISQEPFIKDIPAISKLKLRASWGINGNDQIPFQARFARVSSSNLEAVFGRDEDLYPGASLSNAGNPNLQWENTETYDVGLEFGFLNNKLSGELDYYNKRTNKVLVPLLLPAHFGNGPFNRVVFNAADIRNEGIEFFINWKGQIRDFNYSIGLLGSKLRNTALDIGAADEFIQDGNLNNGQLVTRTEKGGPVGAFYGYKVAGVFQNEEELSSLPALRGQKVGDLRFQDLNGDGQIDTDDRTVLGSYIPDYLLGINLHVSFKGLELDTDIQGQFGNEIYNGKRAVRPELYNFETFILDRWTGPGTSNSQPRLSTGGLNYSPSDWFIEDGSFLRLRSLSLSYAAKQSLVRKLGLKQARIFLRGTNLFTWSKFSGYSPEIASQNVLSSGIDLGIYPITSVYTLGINISL